ncbi:MAG TPA: hypothetical protein VII06_30225 [Chloroflexota bacterium]|jgi:hypothetical protein
MARDFHMNPSRPHADVLRETEQQLAELREFEHDWDGAGANAPTPEAIVRAGALVGAVVAQHPDTESGVVSPFDIAPLPDGGVLVEWRRPEGAIAVFVLANGRYDYLLTEGAGPARRYDERRDVPRETIFRLIAQVLAQPSTA